MIAYSDTRTMLRWWMNRRNYPPPLTFDKYFDEFFNTQIFNEREKVWTFLWAQKLSFLSHLFLSLVIDIEGKSSKFYNFPLNLVLLHVLNKSMPLETKIWDSSTFIWTVLFSVWFVIQLSVDLMSHFTVSESWVESETVSYRLMTSVSNISAEKHVTECELKNFHHSSLDCQSSAFHAMIWTRWTMKISLYQEPGSMLRLE